MTSPHSTRILARMTGPTPLPRAIIFDMDGTLTEPNIDFDQLKRDMGIPGGPILEALAVMNIDQRKNAEEVLHRYEHQAATDSTLNPGCIELLHWLRERKIETALVTRNTRKSVATVFDRHNLHFDVCITREDGKFKPDPAPLQLACTRMNVSHQDTWMVGDGSHDIEAGVAANIRAVWLHHGREKTFAAQPWKAVRDLLELTQLLHNCGRNP